MKILSKELTDLTDIEYLKTPLSKRQLRAKLLAAFDQYKSNVYYGVLSEVPADREKILAWYYKILDLEEEAFTNVPDQILTIYNKSRKGKGEIKLWGLKQAIMK